MPVYEYRCNVCRKEFEINRGIQEEEGEIKCPRCGSEDTHRLYALFGKVASGGRHAPIRFG